MELTTDIRIQLLVAAVVAGAIVSKTMYAVLSRVGTHQAPSAPDELATAGTSNKPGERDTVRELALLTGLDPSRIDVTLTEGTEVHCALHADPNELLELAEVTEAGIDRAFRERHRWTDARVYLHLRS